MSPFTFQSPAHLLLLLLLLPLAVLLRHARGERKRVLRLLDATLSTHRPIRDYLRLLACALLVLAYARPGYSPEPETTSQAGRDVVFALDVSQSMLAQDVRPSRLEVAKQGIRDALDSFNSERVGLLVYAGSASILCPLTYDYDFVRFMLDQANTRTVEFGGTALQAAVEKIVDQVFVQDRANVQDMVILTDGGDHGSNMNAVKNLLEASGSSLLVIGLGDPEIGSPIIFTNESGEETLLEVNGETILTKLEDDNLQQLNSLYEKVRYIPVATQPFNLGQLYLEYAADKPNTKNQTSSGKLVYKDAAVFFLIPALIALILAECWGARGLQFRQATLWLFCFFSLPLCLKAQALDESTLAKFESEIQKLESGNPEAALEGLNQLRSTRSTAPLPKSYLASIEFNRGLCLVQRSNQEAEFFPAKALVSARDAQEAFLQAKRYQPDLQRAGMRLQQIHQTIEALRVRIAEETSKEPESMDNDSQESDEYSDDEGMEEDPSSESDDTTLTNEPMDPSDLASTSSMQELPPPNYSIEDILQEEQGNLQFRQNKRANANSANIEKDY